MCRIIKAFAEKLTSDVNLILSSNVLDVPKADLAAASKGERRYPGATPCNCEPGKPSLEHPVWSMSVTIACIVTDLEVECLALLMKKSNSSNTESHLAESTSTMPIYLKKSSHLAEYIWTMLVYFIKSSITCIIIFFIPDIAYTLIHTEVHIKDST